ncbi:MAG: asparagine synthase (glutamine-hydrolyzing) [Anaerolineales bacterium]|nr:asparagine synthase (glutamine-hydrolyzing) [Anaerolineales bacterium]
MCGIVGFLDAKRGKSAATLSAELGEMMDMIRHRGPDDQHVWTDAEKGVALGFRRLAILDLSVNGRQPMLSANGRYVIIYNGEVYNFQELQKTLEAKGHRFKGGSDTEVMLAAIQAWGVGEATKRFNGMFAFALWDAQEEMLYLVRDRLGIKPLYYGWQGDHFFFGSELKALRRHAAFTAAVDRNALSRYVRFGYVPAPFSIYEQISKLPPASILAVDPKAPGVPLQPIEYWPDGPGRGEGLHTLGQEELLAELDDLLRESVKLRMISDVPLGAFLSGGIDSSLIVALMQAQSAQPVKTFTIGFNEAEYDEAHYAKRIAHVIGTDHTELYLSAQDSLDVIPKLPDIYDEPFADASQIPTYLVSKLAREHVTVALSGDGGDELFLGYNRYFWTPKLWSLTGWWPGAARRLAARSLSALSALQWNALVERLGPAAPMRLRRFRIGDKFETFAETLRIDDPQSLYAHLITFWPGSLVLGAQNGAALPGEPLSGVNGGSLVEWMSAMDIKTYLPDDILVKVDRASMAVSLEARAPFLDDHRVVEFATSLPADMRVRNGKRKWILRQLLAKYLDPELFERPKMGFSVPIDSWLRGPLRPWAEDLLSPQRIRAGGFFNEALIQQKWQEHQSGRRNWQHHLWIVLMFQAWLEKQIGEPALQS